MVALVGHHVYAGRAPPLHALRRRVHAAVSGEKHRSRDVVNVQREVGHQGAVAGGGEGVVGIGAHLRPALGPVHEVIAAPRIGGGDHVHGVAVGVGARPAHAAPRRGLGRGGYIVCVQREVSRKVAVAGGGEGISLGGAHLHTALGPVHEMEAEVSPGCDHKVHGVAVGVGARPAHYPTGRRPGRCLDIVCVQREVGHQVAVAGGGEGIVRVGGNLRPALGPVHEVIAAPRIGGGDHVHGIAVGVGARPAHAAPRRGLGRGGYIVRVQREVGHQGAVAGGGEGVVGIGGYLHPALGPVHEVVAAPRIGGGHQVHGFVVFEWAPPAGSTAIRRVGSRDDMVYVRIEVSYQGAVCRGGEGVVGVRAHLRTALGPAGEMVVIGGGGR